jgi:hypothetical protein
MRVHGTNGIINLEAEEVWEQLPSTAFLSVDEILRDMPDRISNEDQIWIKEHKPDELISLHHSLGRWIRNTYGLWHPNNPLVIKDDLGDGHPDGISQRIIEKFYAKLNTSAYDDAMTILNQEK